MKLRWARVLSHDAYGRWVPTGCVDKEAAIEYMAMYQGLGPQRPTTTQMGSHVGWYGSAGGPVKEQHVREWLLL